MIYTLEYIKREASKIASDWNGKDEKFISGGDVYHEEDVDNADELIQLVNQVEQLAKLLRI